jgi:hypothetical protein
MHSHVLTLSNKGYVVMKSQTERNNNNGLVMVALGTLSC